MKKFQSPRQKEYDAYIDANDFRLSKGLRALGKKNFITKLSVDSIPEIRFKINTISFVQKICAIGDIHLKGRSPTSPYYVILSDDQDAAYFYAGNKEASEPILDAMQIYNTLELVDNKEHLFEIIWSIDGSKAALLINRKFHAAYDFDENRGYCRSNFPPSDPSSIFGEYSHEWSDECIKWFTLDE